MPHAELDPLDEARPMWGYCVVCTRYGEGRYAGPINDRAEAITDHKGCPQEKPPQAEQPRRHHSPGPRRR